MPRLQKTWTAKPKIIIAILIYLKYYTIRIFCDACTFLYANTTVSINKWRRVVQLWLEVQNNDEQMLRISPGVVCMLSTADLSALASVAQPSDQELSSATQTNSVMQNNWFIRYLFNVTKHNIGPLTEIMPTMDIMHNHRNTLLKFQQPKCETVTLPTEMSFYVTCSVLQGPDTRLPRALTNCGGCKAAQLAAEPHGSVLGDSGVQ